MHLAAPASMSGAATLILLLRKGSAGWPVTAGQAERRVSPPLWSGSAIWVAGLFHIGGVLLEDFDHAGCARAFAGDLVPELLPVLDDLVPFFGREGSLLHLLAFDPELRLAAPIPDGAIIMRLVDGRPIKLLEMRGHLLPAWRMRVIGAEPGTGDRVREGVIADIGPAHLVHLGEARPEHAIEIAGPHRDFDIIPGPRHRDQPIARQEAAGRWHAEDPEPVQIGKRADRLVDGEDMERVPGAGREIGDVLDILISFAPDLIEPVIHENGADIGDEAGGE